MFVLVFLSLLAIFASAEIKTETNEVIAEFVNEVSKRDYKESINLDVFFIKLKDIEVTNLKTPKIAGESTWVKDYKGDGSNYDLMNLTLKLDNMRINIKEILVGPTPLTASFDIAENEVKVYMSSKGFVDPTNGCEMTIHDLEVTKLNQVTMHSDFPEFDGKDVSEIFQKFANPIINRLIKTRWFQDFFSMIVGKACAISFKHLDNAVV